MEKMKSYYVRLPIEVGRALDSDAREAGVTSTEFLRHLVIGRCAANSADGSGASQRRVIYEIAKTRSVLLRYIDAQLGEAKADELLRAAEEDARAYIETAGDGTVGGGEG